MLDQKTIDIIKSTVPVLKSHGLESNSRKSFIRSN